MALVRAALLVAALLLNVSCQLGVPRAAPEFLRRHGGVLPTAIPVPMLSEGVSCRFISDIKAEWHYAFWSSEGDLQGIGRVQGFVPNGMLFMLAGYYRTSDKENVFVGEHVYELMLSCSEEGIDIGYLRGGDVGVLEKSGATRRPNILLRGDPEWTWEAQTDLGVSVFKCKRFSPYHDSRWGEVIRVSCTSNPSMEVWFGKEESLLKELDVVLVMDKGTRIVPEYISVVFSNRHGITDIMWTGQGLSRRFYMTYHLDSEPLLKRSQ